MSIGGPLRIYASIGNAFLSLLVSAILAACLFPLTFPINPNPTIGLAVSLVVIAAVSLYYLPRAFGPSPDPAL